MALLAQVSTQKLLTNIISTNFLSISSITGLDSAVAGSFKPIWVGVGNGDYTLAYSYDGINWTGLEVALSSEYGASFVFFNGTMFVAVGYGFTTIGFYSYDGINWNQTNNLESVIDGIEGIFYQNGMWLVGGYGTTRFAYSYDGINWTGVTTTAFGNGVTAICGNGKIWVAGGYASGGDSLGYSYDGINWVGLGSSIITNYVYGMAYGNGVFVAAGGGTNNFAVSKDGISWTGISGVFSYATGVAFNGIMFVAGGNAAQSIAYSYDGYTWTNVDCPILNVYAIAWGGDMWIAQGATYYGTSTAYSYDGIVWTAATNTAFGNYGQGAAYGNASGLNNIQINTGLSVNSISTIGNVYVNSNLYVGPAFYNYSTMSTIGLSTFPTQYVIEADSKRKYVTMNADVQIERTLTHRYKYVVSSLGIDDSFIQPQDIDTRFLFYSVNSPQSVYLPEASSCGPGWNILVNNQSNSCNSIEFYGTSFYVSLYPNSSINIISDGGSWYWY